MERLASMRSTLSLLTHPSSRRIGRKNSENNASMRASSRLNRRSSRIGALFFGKRDRSGSKDSKDSELNSKNTTNVTSYDEEEAGRRLRESRMHRGSKDSSKSGGSKDDENEADKRKSNRLSRKPSKYVMALFSKPEKPQLVMMTDEMIRLETVIQSDKGRQRLVQDLIPIRGDFSVKVRFCSAVETFDAAQDEHERANLAQTIIQTFFVHGCLFYIASLSGARYNAIVNEGNYNQLLDAKREVLEELSRHREVMQIVDHVEALDDV